MSTNEARNDVLWAASSLFKRRAFFRNDEADWGEALYVYAATARAWSEVMKRLTGKSDAKAAAKVQHAIYQLQDSTRIALMLDGTEFDQLKQLVFNRQDFDRRLPHRVDRASNDEGLEIKAKALEQLRSALTSLGASDWLGGGSIGF
jgi:hypothetical protein